MKIRIESSSSTRQNVTGVGYYAKRLTAALSSLPNISVEEAQFDFLGRQLETGYQAERLNFPQKIYAKLHYIGVAPPFDLTLPPVDVTLFPNYALWPTIHSSKSAVTVHDLSFLKFPDVVESKNLSYLKRVVPRAIREADLILTVSETVKSEIIAAYGVSASTIHVTPIPPTDEYFNPSEKNVRKTYGIPTEKYILFASTIEPRKNLETLLDAYALLPDETRNTLSLVIAGGTGWNSDTIQTKIISFQKKYPNIITTGYYDQADAAALYQQASIFVMPSHYEGFGMPLLEAMAAKTPCIASNIPVLREVAGDAALYFQPNNPDELAKQLKELLANDSLRHKMVAAGNLNLQRYSWDKVAIDLVEKLRSIS